jgi:hypothetical protein
MPASSTAEPEKTRNRSKRSWKFLIIAGLMVAASLVLLGPALVSSRGGPGHELIRSTNNMRQIGLALMEFESEFGRMPSPATIELVRARYPVTEVPMGTRSSNDYFHQLFAAQIVVSRSFFYGYGVSDHKPGDWLENEPPLPPGSCGFAYIIHDAEAIPPNTPLLLYPLIRGQLAFDKKLCKLWNNQVAVLYADSTVSIHKLDSKSRLIINGHDFFDPAQPHWNGGTFRVVWPE